MENTTQETKTIGCGNLTIVRTAKRIGKKLIATLLMVVMLTSMGSGVMALTPTTPRDQVYIKKIRVYPTYTDGQEVFRMSSTYVDKIYSNYEPYGGTVISVAKQDEFWNKFTSSGYNQVGWCVVIDYLVDTASYSSCTLRYEVDGQNTTTKYNISGGNYSYTYWVDGTSKVPTWSGTITRPNGLDSAFWATVTLK